MLETGPSNTYTIFSTTEAPINTYPVSEAYEPRQLCSKSANVSLSKDSLKTRCGVPGNSWNLGFHSGNKMASRGHV